ncbi:sugar ABC transporter substrate-binding protein [Jeotgalibaca sp. MA1X17-3]|uniref:ABC transporter substrate-binding protein n=1 Tax=Jeotgalibaca sp. MA1X17-3 TaxID=2908211 RepID=UPI001F1EA3F8|nr:sugar ABC transporter substrate-binding protein [Jeotgalibaca sp. MA1X17-3]UJF15856.1 sugar ABC transporter substrate-binding protein [Jeotgalibaca sp. MA1X17-3]
MKLFKKSMYILLGSALLAGCGSNDSETDGSLSGEADSEITTVSLAFWNQNQEPVLREILDNFEDENPNIKVEFEITPNPQYWTRLEAAASGEVMPDIVWMNGPNFVQYAANEIIEPIDSYLKDSEIDLNNYPDSLLELYTYDDELYGIPKDWDTTSLWYNKNIFDDAGVSYPEDDWTWEEMIEAAEAITDVDNDIYGVSANIQTQEGIYNQIFQNKGFVINEDRTKSGYSDSNTIEAFEKHVDLIKKGLSPDLNVQSESSARDLFASGRLGMAYLASWNIPVLMESEVSDHIDLVEMPSMKEKGAVIHGLIYALSASSTNKEEAAAVIKYLGSEEANKVWAESGVIIPGHEGMLNTWVESYPELNLEAYVNSLEYSHPFPVSENTSKWNDYESQAINDIYSLDTNISERLNTLAEQMNKALEEEK